MKVGIVSDTHDHLPNILEAVKLFNKEKVELVIHCGDWCSPFAPDFFAGLNCPIKSVFGNNDADVFKMLSKKYAVPIEFSKNVMELSIGGKKAVVYHGEEQAITESLLASKKYDVVITGHTHQTVNERKDGVLQINPGTLSHFKAGKINSEFTVSIYDSSLDAAKIVKL